MVKELFVDVLGFVPVPTLADTHWEDYFSSLT